MHFLHRHFRNWPLWHYPLSAALLLWCGPLRAQVGFGPEVAVGMSNYRFAPALLFSQASKQPVLYARVGGVVDIPMDKHFCFQAGISFSTKGTNRSFSYHASDSSYEYIGQNMRLYYAEVPATILFKTGQQGKLRCVVGMGAIAAYQVAGRVSVTDRYRNDSDMATTSMHFAAQPGNPIAAFDVAIHLVGGIETATGLSVKLFYTAGINNLGMGTEIDKSRAWGLSGSWLFGKGRNINKDEDDLIDHSAAE